VASIYSVGLSYGKQLIEQFTEKYSNTTVHMEYHHPDRVYELVARGRWTSGWSATPRRLASITAIPWRDESMILVCSPPIRWRSVASHGGGHRRVADHRIRPGLPIRRNIDRQLAEFGIAVETAIAFDNVDTIKRAIVVNAGASFLPAPSVQSELATGELVSVASKTVSLTRPLGIIHRRGIEPSPDGQRFIELLTGTAYSARLPSAAPVGQEGQRPRRKNPEKVTRDRIVGGA
jgi:DNA-binding transcriptional LysR family regulator